MGLKQSEDERCYKSLNNLMPEEYRLMAKKSGSLTKYVELKRRYLKSTYRCMRFDLGPHVDALAYLGSARYIPLHNLNHGVNNLLGGALIM